MLLGHVKDERYDVDLVVAPELSPAFVHATVTELAMERHDVRRVARTAILRMAVACVLPVG